MTLLLFTAMVVVGCALVLLVGHYTGRRCEWARLRIMLDERTLQHKAQRESAHRLEKQCETLKAEVAGLRLQRGQLQRDNTRLKGERDTLDRQYRDLATMLRRALRRMKQYEMDVDTSPPRDHRQFMEAARMLMKKYGLTGSPLRSRGEREEE